MTNPKAKNKRMRENAAPETAVSKKDIRVKVLLSKAENRMLKEEASRLNLSASAYVRMLIREATGIKESPHNTL